MSPEEQSRQHAEDFAAEYLSVVAQFSARLDAHENLLVILAQKLGEDPEVFRQILKTLEAEYVENKLLTVESSSPCLAALASVFAEGCDSLRRHKASRDSQRKGDQDS
jgi:hypothetical protein